MLRGITLAASVGLLAATGTIPESMIDPWTKLTATAILGAVVIIMTLKLWPAAIKTWREDNLVNQEKLAELTKRSIQAVEKNAAAVDKQSDALENLKDHCLLSQRERN